MLEVTPACVVPEGCFALWVVTKSYGIITSCLWDHGNLSLPNELAIAGYAGAATPKSISVAKPALFSVSMALHKGTTAEATSWPQIFILL